MEPALKKTHLPKVDVRQTGQQVGRLPHQRKKAHKIVGRKDALPAGGDVHGMR